MWQDIVITIVQWVLLIALIPSIRHPEHKPALWSSIMTGTLLCVLAGTFWTLGLWSGALSALAVAGGWFVLAWQRWKLNRAHHTEAPR
jgi:hypothetical protein